MGRPGFELGDITLADGPEFEQMFCHEITAKTGLPAVTTAGALIEAIRDLAAQRVAFTSPYVTQLADAAVDFIEQFGADVCLSQATRGRYERDRAGWLSFHGSELVTDIVV